MAERTQTKGRPLAVPCAGSSRWDLDHGGLAQWRAAIAVCQDSCPLLIACRDRRDTMYATGRGPAGVIWAGQAYGDDSRPLTEDQLRRRQDRSLTRLDAAS